jgi:hypothetical protein
MKTLCLMFAGAALLSPALAQAQAVPTSPTDERRLTPEQVEAVLAEAAKKAPAPQTYVGAPAIVADEDLPPARQVHGEVGVGIGTGGYREAFGTAIYPIGDDGVAAISFDFTGWGNRRRWPR